MFQYNHSLSLSSLLSSVPAVTPVGGAVEAVPGCANGVYAALPAVCPVVVRRRRGRRRECECECEFESRVVTAVDE